MGEYALGGSGPINEEVLEEVFNEDIKVNSFLELTTNNEFFMTGSRAWGLGKNDSDFDFCCKLPLYTVVKELLIREGVKFKEHDNFSALYLADKTGLYNIIALEEHEYDSWLFATKTMRFFSRFNYLEDDMPKNQIYGIFGILKSIERILRI